MLRPRHFAAPVMLAVLVGTLAFGQDKEKIKYLTPTWKGSTGLFNLSLADTLRQGEWTIGVNGMKFNREPGDIDFTIFPVSFTLGLHDRLEIFGSWEAYKRVNADQIMVHKVNNPNFPQLPARLSSGIQAWYNDAPFMDVGFGDGTGDLWTGLKLNILSERRGGPLGFAVQPIARFHLTDSREHLARGLTAGATDYGADAILSKNLKGGGYITGNAGILLAQDVHNLDRQNRFNYGVGFDAPLGTLKAHVIGELVGSTFYCTDNPPLGNPVSPLDLYAGLRVHPSKWIAISGAYNLNLRTIDESRYGVEATGRHGFFAQVALQRKINRPPTVVCSVDKPTITGSAGNIEGDKATVRVTVTDEDDDTLTVNWRTSGGKLTQQENAAVFDSTGVAPGKYTVTAEVTDGENTASCTSDITVEKRKLPPTISCQPGTVTIIENESTTLRATASDPNNDPLTYTWTVDGQPVTNNQPEFVFGATGRTIGTHTVVVTVTDVDGMTANCSFTVTINRRPNRPPTVTLSLDKSEAYAGDTITGTAQASDPDNDPLTYSWTVDGQQRPETGNTITINTAGMAGGSHTVTVTVRDDRDGTATATQSFSLREKVIIQINRIRPDNVAKAKLDEIALKLQQDPRLRMSITGYDDDRSSDRIAERNGLRRAEAVKDYLVRQHKIDAARIDTKSGGKTNPIADNATAEGRRQNRRVEIELFVP
ncbi:MAG: PKD domain-containing protein [Acidobacteriota bacterium]